MRKPFVFLLIFLLPLLLNSTSSDSWIVSEIEIRGVRNVKEKLIRKTIKAKEGKEYYDEYKKSDIESILNLGSIENVSVEIATTTAKNRCRVIYTIVEKPYIAEVEVSGNKKLSASKIKSELGVDKGDFYDRGKIEEGISKVLERYREKGYYFASINISTGSVTDKGKIKEGVMKVKVEISEGEQVRVREVNIRGLDDEKQLRRILKIMKNRPKKIFIESNISNDWEGIERYYKNNGFMEFKISSFGYRISEGRFADLNVDLSVGRRYVFGKSTITIEGDNVFRDEMRRIEDAVEYRAGELFSEEKIKSTIRNIQEIYAEKGYLMADVSITTKAYSSSGNYDILDTTISIRENFPFYVREIYIEGKVNTSTKTFAREIIQNDKGSCERKGLDKKCYSFDMKKIRRSQERIFNLGFVEDINLEIRPTETPDEVNLVFEITEGKAGMLTAGGGVSSKDGFMGMISASHLNMFGRANRMSLNWNFGKRVQDYSFNWLIPWVYDKPTSVGFSIFNNRRYRSYSTTYSAYTQRTSGGSVSVSPRFEDDKYALKFGYSYEKIRIYDVKEIYKNEILEGTSVQSSVSIEFSRDTRDYIWDPTSGTKFSVAVEIFGGLFGGDINIYKPSLSYSYNKRLFSIGGWPFVFSLANRFGWVRGFSDTKAVPVYERFFLGGADTVRGYNSNGQIGPLNGGRVYYVANFEFKFPLHREKKRTIVQWAFFLDIGNSWGSFRDVSFKIGTPLRYLKSGAGFGIRFTTPAFPIRLDWGYGFNHRAGEQKSDIYFTIGNLF